MRKDICGILQMCIDISNNTKTDVLFSYYPHTDCFTIFWYIDGWHKVAKVDGYETYYFDNPDCICKATQDLIDVYHEAGGVRVLD